MKSILLFTALCCATPAYAGCGTTFCALNTYWDTQGLANKEGLRIDLRYSYARADTPRRGSSKVSNDPTLAAPGDEVENLRTVNQIFNLDLDYAINRQFGITLGLPWVMRDHSHTLAPATVEQGKFSQLGDLRVVGNYQFDANDPHSGDSHSGSGIRLGLKLPSGKTDWQFQPDLVGERSLQPGSGSTDAILGTYYHQGWAGASWGWFASGQIQAALHTKNGYRPGNDVALDVGTYYEISPALTGLLQLNAQFKQRDSGPNANPHSGGRSLNLSPGLSYAVIPMTRLYGYLQLPVYQYANPDPDPAVTTGQLTAPRSFAVGVSHSY